MYKYIQDIQDIYKIPGDGQAAAARPGPAPWRRSRSGPGAVQNDNTMLTNLVARPGDLERQYQVFLGICS